MICALELERSKVRFAIITKTGKCQVSAVPHQITWIQFSLGITHYPFFGRTGLSSGDPLCELTPRFYHLENLLALDDDASDAFRGSNVCLEV